MVLVDAHDQRPTQMRVRSTHRPWSRRPRWVRLAIFAACVATAAAASTVQVTALEVVVGHSTIDQQILRTTAGYLERNLKVAPGSTEGSSDDDQDADKVVDDAEAEDDAAEDDAASGQEDGDDASSGSVSGEGASSDRMAGWTLVTDVETLAKFTAEDVVASTSDAELKESKSDLLGNGSGSGVETEGEGGDEDGEGAASAAAASGGDKPSEGDAEADADVDTATTEEEEEEARRLEEDTAEKEKAFADIKNALALISGPKAITDLAVKQEETTAPPAKEEETTAPPVKELTATSAITDVSTTLAEAKDNATMAGTPSPPLAFMANRRITHNNYSHGFLGGINESFVFEADAFSDNEQLVVILSDDEAKAGEAIIKSQATGKFWSFDSETKRIIWGDHDKALVLQIYVNAAQDAVLFKTKDNQFVSFRSFEKDQLTPKRELQQALTLVNVVTENAIFSASSSSTSKEQNEDRATQINAYITKIRHAALKKGQEPSPFFVAYDLAFAVLLEKSFNEFTVNNCTEVDLNLLICTMAQVMVTQIPEYKIQFPSFGKTLPTKIDLSTFALANNIDATIAQPVAYGLEIGSLFTSLAGKTNVIMARTACFVGAVVGYTLLQDLDTQSEVFATNETNYQKAIFTHYTYSSRLAFLMENKTTNQKLAFTEILYPKGSKTKPYLEKNEYGIYWFSPFVNLNISNFRNFNILPELGLLDYLPKAFVEQETMVGDGIATAVIAEVTSLVTKNDIKGVSKFAQHEHFLAAAAKAASFCSNGTSTAKFCVIPQVSAQIGILGVADQSLFSNRKQTTSLLGGADVGLQTMMRELYNAKGNGQVIEVLTQKKNELMDFLKTSVDTVAANIQDDTLKTMIMTADQQAKSQKALSDHLSSVGDFDEEAKFSQYQKKMKLMQIGIQSALDHQENMIEEIKDLAKRATVEAAIESLIDLIGTAVAALQVANPVTGFNPLAIGDLVGEANGLSKSVAVLASTGSLAGKLDGELGGKVADIVARMVNYQSEVQKVTEAAKPLMNGDKIAMDQLDQFASNFLAVYSNFKAPVTQAEVDQIREYFSEVVDSLCEVIDINGYNACVTVPGLVVKVFGGLAESMDLAQDAITILFDVATAAVNVQNAKQMAEDAEAQLSGTKQNMELLSNKWANNDTSKEIWWQDWKKKQSYSNAITSIGLTMNQARLLATVVEFCNQDVYLNGGLPNEICATTVFAGKPISDELIEQLIDAKSDKKPTSLQFQPLIPVKAFNGQNKGFLDIGKLMNGESVPFQVPVDDKWLDQMGWEFGALNLDTSVLYVKSFAIFLPPRFDTFMKSESTTTVTVRSTGVSSFGRALNGKTFAIPPSDATFVTKYATRPASHKSGKCEVVTLAGLSGCNSKLPKICKLSTGAAAKRHKGSFFMPSLFSPFHVSLKFNTPPAKANLLQYGNVTSDMYLRAHVELAAFTDVTWTVPTSGGGGGGDDAASGSGADGADGDAESASGSGTKKAAASGSGSNAAAGEGNAKVQPAETDADDADIPDFRMRRLRALKAKDPEGEGESAAGKDGRCCPVGQYMNLIKSDCMTCPSGSVSQLGGYFCVAVGADAGASSTEERARRQLRQSA